MNGLIERDASMSEKVRALEDEVLALPQVDLSTTHVLCGGIYARTITIPAGVVLTGAAHKKDHVCVAQGDITVLTDDGPKRLHGQHVLATKAGMKRAGVAHAETRWTTLCRTDLTDLAAIEDELVEEPEKLQTRVLELAHASGLKLED